MYKEVPEDLKNTIKAVADAMNKHNCVVHTMLFAVGENNYGYKPRLGPKKRKYCKVPKDRLKECGQIFREAHNSLKEEGIELLICLMSSKKGGVMIFVSEEAAKRRLDIFRELEKMEKRHAKIS